MLQSSETERCVRAARRGDSWIQHTAASAMHIMAELRLSNKGFQAFSLKHPYSRLQAHSLNPGDPYEPRPDVHGMLSVSA